MALMGMLCVALGCLLLSPTILVKETLEAASLRCHGTLNTSWVARGGSVQGKAAWRLTCTPVGYPAYVAFP